MTRVSTLDEIFPEARGNASRTTRPNRASDRRLGGSEHRRGTITLRVLVTGRSPAGTIFMPFHFAEAAANVLTDNRLDQRAKIPDYKVCGVSIAKATVVPDRGRRGDCFGGSRNDQIGVVSKQKTRLCHAEGRRSIPVCIKAGMLRRPSA